MGTAGLALLTGGIIGAGFHLFLYEWNREARREAKWAIAIGFCASAVLALLGAVLCLYDITSQGIAIPRFQVEAPYALALGLFFVIAVWFWFRRGIFNKVAALACVYVLFVFFNIIPDPSQSETPWPLLVLVGLIGLRWLSGLQDGTNES